MPVLVDGMPVTTTPNPAWPQELHSYLPWTTIMFASVFYTAAVTAASLLAASHLRSSSASNTTSASSAFATPALQSSFTAFRRNYLLVYLLVNASDWLCGPYLYSVYKEHGLDLAWISSLSIVGFLSSAVLGSYLGSLSDTYGRRRLCLLYPVTFALSCICIQFPSLPLLIAGRVFGGISTSLLFSVFETWMTSEYFKRGFPGSELGGLFSSAVTLNSLVAIGAGLVANAAADAMGTSRVPFLLAIVPAGVGSLVVAWSWTENYGATASSSSSSSQAQVSVWGAIKDEPAIAYVGIVQACFEGAMYGFVCLFGAALDEYAKSLDSGLPFGLIFATFMIFCMIGSTLCNLAPLSRESLLMPSMLTAVAALYAAATATSLLARFLAFCFFELTVGLYFPLIFSLRSKVIPEQVRGTVLSMFRVPLNAIVVGLLTRVGADPVDKVLLLCAGLCGVSAVAGGLMWRRSLGKSGRQAGAEPAADQAQRAEGVGDEQGEATGAGAGASGQARRSTRLRRKGD